MFGFFQSTFERPAFYKRMHIVFTLRSLLSGAVLVIVFASSFLAFSSCKKSPTGPDTHDNIKKWTVIPELSKFSIRYMIQFHDKLYLSAIDLNAKWDNNNAKWIDERGLVYRTEDGNHWEKVFGIQHSVGPFAINGDSLYLHGDDTLYMYSETIGWKPKLATPGLASESKSLSDMTFIGKNLFLMQGYYSSVLQTWCLFPDGSSVEIKGYHNMSYAGTKYLKVKHNNQEIVYTRGNYLAYGFWVFDGSKYHELIQGLTQRELNACNPCNSMAYHNDTLFAGFKGPSSIKTLVNDVWLPYTDTLPYSDSARHFYPILKTETIAITLVEERLFVSTQCLGVLEYKRPGGWTRMSEGLRVIPEVTAGTLKDVWEPVPFLEYYKGYLIAGYGRPAFAPWETAQENTGVYIYSLQ